MTAVVVGGGISGILSALLLRQQHESVLLVEKAPELGGLLRSERLHEGLSFDMGTHIISSTAHPALDALILGYPEITSDWNQYDLLRAGNYLLGRLNADSPCLDANSLPPDVFAKGLAELLSITQPPSSPEHLKAQLDGMYGPTLADHLFAPILNKILGKPLHDLDSRAHEIFFSQRIVLLTPQASRELKASAVYGEKVAYHSYREGASGLTYYYPKAGGIGRWVDLLTETLRERGVELATEATVSSIELSDREIHALTLSNGRKVACAQLVWTLPPALLMGLCGFSTERVSSPVELRRTYLFHFVFDRPFESDLFYVTCYDPMLLTYRVTLYPNIRDGLAPQAPHNCTVEVIASPDADPAQMVGRLVDELRQMGLIDADATLLFSHSSGLWHGFPVRSKGLMAAMRQQTSVLEAALDNVLLLGRSKGESFFMRDVLVETFERLQPQPLDTVVPRHDLLRPSPEGMKVN